jgi:hypothetical protein
MTAPATPPATHSPNDFCRTCKGKGKLQEPGERGVIITSDCWSCGGSGYGK